MSKKVVLFLHGFASSGRGAKAEYLRERFGSYPGGEFHALDFNPTPKDFEYLTVTGMVNRLRQYVWDHDLKVCGLIGSSMGALVGLNYAHRFAGVEKLLLLAPALSYMEGLNKDELETWRRAGKILTTHYAFEREIALRYDLHLDGTRYLEPVPPAVPIRIVHGRYDEVIPIHKSREYEARYPDRVELFELDSDHTLNDQLPFIWEQVKSFFLA